MKPIPALATAAVLGAAVLGVAGVSGVAAADPVAVDVDRMTVPAKQLVIHALLEVNLSDQAVGEPVSIAPDIWYGATDKLTLGLVHSGHAAGGFFGGVGDGLCLTGEDKGCAKVYDRAGLLARYHLHDGPFTVALDGGLLAQSFDPFTVSLKLGIAARWHRGKVAFDLAPNLWFGLNERDAGNEERIAVPLSITYAVAPRLALAAQTGLAAPVQDLSDNLVVPFSVGAQVLATDSLYFDLAFSLPRLIDQDDNVDAVDIRTLTLGVGHGF